MKVRMLTTVKTSIGSVPHVVDGKQCVVDLPDAEARQLINCYKATLTKGEPVNFPVDKKSK
jgi:hypothetical protein